MFTSVLHSNGHDATLTTQKTPFPLLLHNRHAYRGIAYKLPEQIRWNIIMWGEMVAGWREMA
jgi:hypothetical protein